MKDTLGNGLTDERNTGHEVEAAKTGAMNSPDNHVAASILQIPLTLQVVIGTTRLPLSRLIELRAGSLVELDQRLGTAAVILINGREVARGDLFVLDDEESRLGLSITEVYAAHRANGGP